MRPNSSLRTVFLQVTPCVARLAAACLLLGLLATDRSAAADREQIEATLNEIAEALEANDLELVCTFIEPDAEATRTLAAVNMALVTVKSAKVRNLEV